MKAISLVYDECARPRRWTRGLLTALCLGLASLPLTAAESSVDFDRDVRPLLVARCFNCHGEIEQESGLRLDRRAAVLKGGESGEPAVVPGRPVQSELLRRVNAMDEAEVMPPEGERLTPEEVAVLTKWIESGAKMPDSVVSDSRPPLWSLQPIQTASPPERDNSFVTTPVDAFILDRLSAGGLSPSPPADRRTFIRRAYLDVVGFPPSPAEVDEFIHDSDPCAVEHLVDRLLASPHYGERWAQHWLDVVRYGDTHGFEVNTPRPNSWPYRDWVIRALNEDLPYDQFVFRQLAGDAAGDDAATGFLVAGPALLPGQIGKDPASKKQARQDELNEIINATSATFLGLTVSCARCHNHKFDPITQSDYYGLQAVFAGVLYGERSWRGPETAEYERQRQQVAADLAAIEQDLDALEPVQTEPRQGTLRSCRPAVNAMRNVERFPPLRARFVRFVVDATNNGIEPCLDELEIYSPDNPLRNLARKDQGAGAKTKSSSNYPSDSKHLLAHINDGRYGNSFSWISGEPGRGWVEVELPDVITIHRIVWGRDRDGAYDDRLPVTYRIEVAEIPGEWKVVASSNTRAPWSGTAGSKEPGEAKSPSSPEAEQFQKILNRFRELRGRAADLMTEPKVFAGVFQQPETTYRLHRGEPMQPREETPPSILAALEAVTGPLGVPPDATEQQRREALALWITHPKNPFTARVMVNRIWQHHFGTGIVDTPSDFGRNGSRPSHPELLDFLARSFMDSGWSMKSLHRELLLSSTYRQSDRPRPEALAKDANTRLLWRYPPRRLEAEVIRDSILRVAGTLDLSMGGPGFLVFKPNQNYVRVYDAKEDWGPSDWRRMIYVHKVRIAQDGVFGAFDCPDAGLPAPRRSTSTTALQSLNLLNSTFVVQQSELMAESIANTAGTDVEQQVAQAFRRTCQRHPTPAEQQACADLVRHHGLAALCRVLFNSNEFLFLP